MAQIRQSGIESERAALAPPVVVSPEQRDRAEAAQRQERARTVERAQRTVERDEGGDRAEHS